MKMTQASCAPSQRDEQRPIIATMTTEKCLELTERCGSYREINCDRFSGRAGIRQWMSEKKVEADSVSKSRSRDRTRTNTPWSRVLFGQSREGMARGPGTREILFLCCMKVSEVLREWSNEVGRDVCAGRVTDRMGREDCKKW